MQILLQVLYIRCVYMVMCPCLDLTQAYLIYHFPIKGRRLQQLEREQARSFRAVQRRSTSTISVASKLRLCLFLNSVLK